MNAIENNFYGIHVLKNSNLGGVVHCLPILGLKMNAKKTIVFMFKVHLPHAQATGNCAISLTITSHSD